MFSYTKLSVSSTDICSLTEFNRRNKLPPSDWSGGSRFIAFGVDPVRYL